MAVIKGDENRRVLPNWREFSTTAQLGELGLAKGNGSLLPAPSIDKYIKDFSVNKEIPFAAELISIASANDDLDYEEVNEAAILIAENPDKTTYSQQNLAKHILSNGEKESLIPSNDPLTICTKQQLIAEYRPKVHNLKLILSCNNFNAIAWVDLARCYSILGHKDKAISCMDIAVALQPNNRFVLRSAVRLYTHYDLADKAIWFLNHSSATKYDPWLLSAELSVSMLMKRQSPLVKIGIQMAESDNFTPFSITELSASLGTLEFYCGSRKKSKKMFQRAQVAPNDNSAAQIEWVLSKDSSILSREQFKPIIRNNYEAIALDTYYSKEYASSIPHILNWLNDMPYSKRPIMLGTSASELLGDRDLTMSLLEYGLLTNPQDPAFLNNKAYYLALNDKAVEAGAILSRLYMNRDMTDRESICAIATKGLVEFRSGNVANGAGLYSLAIKKAIDLHELEMAKSAALNYLRELMRNEDGNEEQVLNLLSKLPENNTDPLVSKLEDEVIAEYKKRNS